MESYAKQNKMKQNKTKKHLDRTEKVNEILCGPLHGGAQVTLVLVAIAHRDLTKSDFTYT